MDWEKFYINVLHTIYSHHNAPRLSSYGEKYFLDLITKNDNLSMLLKIGRSFNTSNTFGSECCIPTDEGNWHIPLKHAYRRVNIGHLHSGKDPTSRKDMSYVSLLLSEFKDLIHNELIKEIAKKILGNLEDMNFGNYVPSNKFIIDVSSQRQLYDKAPACRKYFNIAMQKALSEKQKKQIFCPDQRDIRNLWVNSFDLVICGNYPRFLFKEPNVALYEEQNLLDISCQFGVYIPKNCDIYITKNGKQIPLSL